MENIFDSLRAHFNSLRAHCVLIEKKGISPFTLGAFYPLTRKGVIRDDKGKERFLSFDKNGKAHFIIGHDCFDKPLYAVFKKMH